ncbi:PspC family transcriptional regulator [Prevotella sp. oral taxon 376]|uniref:PspC domain-containing protein n=1 Tax=Prevotella sp. oral taxon 376 TaxID=712466 RepID=UPI000D1F54E5|nr:PspC domain-containing protein [Prevotella sp. oral taxon 376]PTL32469.1 PspC family transcriptional regulator [Prevotella sp. oral taxon 376]
MSTGKRLERSADRILGGVCAGIAEYFDWDPTVVRVVYTLLTFCTAFSGIIVYILLWFVMPPKT